VTLPAFPGATSVSALAVYDAVGSDGLAGGTPHLHTVSAEAYLVVGGRGRLLAPGVAGGDELRGTRAPWMGFTGRHDETDAASTIVMVDDPANLQHPPQWFARSEDFACLCPAPFFGEEHVVEPGATLVLRYGVVVADGASDPERAARLADAAAAGLPELLGAP